MVGENKTKFILCPSSKEEIVFFATSHMLKIHILIVTQFQSAADTLTSKTMVFIFYFQLLVFCLIYQKQWYNFRYGRNLINFQNLLNHHNSAQGQFLKEEF